MSNPFPGSVSIPVAVGELIDKISILEIKSERITDPDKLRNVRLELTVLIEARNEVITTTTNLAALAAELKTTNEALWDVEDALRVHERNQDFGAEFIKLARTVYHQNDRRAALKRRINELLGSALVEEKSYEAYV
jgi:Family of unknown function (DUF6165)